MGYLIEGVALVAMGASGRILFLEELEDKENLGKRRGDVSIPMETRKKGEGVSDALRRLVLEEMPAGVHPELDGAISLGGFVICGTALVKAYFVRWEGEECCCAPVDDQGDVRIIGWREPGWIRDQGVRCRVGAPEMIAAALECLELRLEAT